MFDFYTSVSLYAVYIIGGLILAAIIVSFLHDAAKADPVTKKKLIKVYALLFIGSIVLVGGLNYFKVSERLFPSFYEREELREQLDEATPWEQNFKLEDWRQPFNGTE